MKENEVLIIGNGLDISKDKERILKAYNTKFLDSLLTKTLIQIGFKSEDVEYGARFENSRVEMYYTLKHNKKISFLSKNIDFNKGDEIIVAVSYKYNEHDFKSFMKLYFDDAQVFTLINLMLLLFAKNSRGVYCISFLKINFELIRKV